MFSYFFLPNLLFKKPEHKRPVDLALAIGLVAGWHAGNLHMTEMWLHFPQNVAEAAMRVLSVEYVLSGEKRVVSGRWVVLVRC